MRRAHGSPFYPDVTPLWCSHLSLVTALFDAAPGASEPEFVAEGNCCASHHRTGPCRRRYRAHAVRHPPSPRGRKRCRRARPRGRVHPGGAGLAGYVDRPRRPRPDPERTRTRAVGCCHRAGLRHHRPDRGPASVRTGRLDPRRVAGRVHRGGGSQPRPASGRHRPHRGCRPTHLRAGRLAGPGRPRPPQDGPDRPDPRRRRRRRVDRGAARARAGRPRDRHRSYRGTGRSLSAWVPTRSWTCRPTGWRTPARSTSHST